MTILGVYFLHSRWLWVIPFIGILWVAGLLALALRKRRFAEFAVESIWSQIAPELSWSFLKAKYLTWLLSLFFVVIALARPQWGSHEETVRTTGLDIVLLIDVSRSMETEDIFPSRLKKVKHFIRNLSERVQGDRLGVVVFAGSAHLACPLTNDLAYVMETIDGLSPNSVSNQGTDMGLGLEYAERALDRGAEQANPGEAPSAATRVIALFSDAEDHEGQVENGAKKLRESGAKFYAFGVGTEKGGPIPIRDENGQNFGFKRDKSGSSVVSQFHADALQKLAQELGGKFWTMTNSEGELDEFVQDLKGLARGELDERRIVVREEKYQWPLAAAILLMLIEFSIPARKMMKLSILLLALGGVLKASSAYAEGFAPADPSIQGYFENKKGMQEFQREHLSEAKKHFSAAQVEDPDFPEFGFNQGVMQLKQEDFDHAAQSFDQSAVIALKQGNAELVGVARYNQGIALTQKKDIGGAIQAYLGAIDQAKAAQDKALEADARKNLELLIQQQQSQGGGKSDQDQQKDKQDSKDKDKSDPSQAGKNANNGGEKKDEPKPGEGDGKNKKEPQAITRGNAPREFKSQKLSKDAADRVMAELTRREKELQERMKRQRGRPQSLEKDW